MLPNTTAIPANVPFKIEPATSQTTQKCKRVCQVIKAKMEQIWQAFVAIWIKVMQTFGCLPRLSAKAVLSQKIRVHLENINTAKAAFETFSQQKITSPDQAKKLQETSLAKKNAWIQSYETALYSIWGDILTAKLDPVRVPKRIAFQLTEILTAYGIALYNNKEVGDPYENSQNVLKNALLMQKYALGLSDTNPDLYFAFPNYTFRDPTNPRQFLGIKAADEAIATLDAGEWSKKSANLNLDQLKQLVLILRYLNGCMRYLRQENLTTSGLLLGTAEACLKAARSNPNISLIDLNDILAELKYNEISGFIATQAKALDEKGEKELAKAEWVKLNDLWDEVVLLSKEPAKMQARCDNKRTFCKKLPPQEIVDFRLKSVAAHRNLPAEKQDRALLALALNNLSKAYQDLDPSDKNQELQDLAFDCVQEAWAIIIELMAQGKTDSQFDAIVDNYQKLALKQIEKSTQLNQQLALIQSEAPLNLDPKAAEDMSNRLQSIVQAMDRLDAGQDFEEMKSVTMPDYDKGDRKRAVD